MNSFSSNTSSRGTATSLAQELKVLGYIENDNLTITTCFLHSLSLTISSLVLKFIVGSSVDKTITLQLLYLLYAMEKEFEYDEFKVI